MSTKKLCMECLSGMNKLGADGLVMIESEQHLRTHDYFSYAQFICNGCVNFLVSDRGEFPGAPREGIKNLYFLWDHFKWLFSKAKREMNITEESKAQYNMVYANRNKFISFAMKQIEAEPLELKNILDKLDQKIYKSITGKDFAIKEHMIHTKGKR